MFQKHYKNCFRQTLSYNFLKGVSKNALYTVQILEKLGGNRRITCGALDVSIT